MQFLIGLLYPLTYSPGGIFIFSNNQRTRNASYVMTDTFADDTGFLFNDQDLTEARIKLNPVFEVLKVGNEMEIKNQWLEE